MSSIESRPGEHFDCSRREKYAPRNRWPKPAPFSAQYEQYFCWNSWCRLTSRFRNSRSIQMYGSRSDRRSTVSRSLVTWQLISSYIWPESSTGSWTSTAGAGCRRCHRFLGHCDSWRLLICFQRVGVQDHTACPFVGEQRSAQKGYGALASLWPHYSIRLAIQELVNLEDLWCSPDKRILAASNHVS